jgi:hypothetical protein
MGHPWRAGFGLFLPLLPRLLLILLFHLPLTWPDDLAPTLLGGVGPPPSPALLIRGSGTGISQEELSARVTWLDVKRDELLWSLIASPCCFFFVVFALFLLSLKGFHASTSFRPNPPCRDACSRWGHRTVRHRFGCVPQQYFALLPSVVRVFVSLGVRGIFRFFTLGILATDMTFVSSRSNI